MSCCPIRISQHGEEVDMIRLRMTCAVCWGVAVAATSLGETPDGRGKGESPFELRILLDAERDEVAVQVVNRSVGREPIHMDTLDRINVETDPVRDEKTTDLTSSGYGFRRSRLSSPEGLVVYLRQGQSVGLRFSFCRHEVLGSAGGKVLSQIEGMLKKAKEVRYRVSLAVLVPDADGEPVKGPRLKSNTLLIDRETLRALKAARAKIDRQVKEAIGVTRPPTAAADPASPQGAPDRGGSARSRDGA
jgi:hypothetical protein